MKTAAIVIGVDRTGELPPLEGAAAGAEDFADWARDQGMDVTLLTDGEGREVRLDQILDVIEPIVNPPTYQKLVVYFAGHGFLLAPSTELWLLSRAPDRASEAVNVALSRDHARYSGIPHVIFVSDACRSGGPTHRHRSVVGGSIFPTPASYEHDGEVDTFYATRPGDAALEFADESEAVQNYKGIFTECLLNALEGFEPSVVHTEGAGEATRWFIPCRQLKPYLVDAVPSRAETISIRLKQSPEVRVESAPPKVFGKLDRAPSQSVRSGFEFTPEPELHRFVESVQPRAMSFEDEVEIEAEDTAAARLFAAQMQSIAAARGRDHYETETGFTVHGRLLSATAGGDAVTEDFMDGERTHIRIRPSGRGDERSILIELESGMGTVLAIEPGFIGTVLLEDERVVNVSYTPSSNTPVFGEEYSSQAERIERRRAFAAAASRHGMFEIEGEDAADAAGYLRMMKRLDPTLGIYAAYAYHQAGRVKQIREVLSYMEQDSPVVPFDVLLLAHAKDLSRAAPFCPMLSQGWALLDLQPSAAAALSDLRPLLVPALWTTLEPEGVARVKELLERKSFR